MSIYLVSAYKQSYHPKNRRLSSIVSALADTMKDLTLDYTAAEFVALQSMYNMDMLQMPRKQNTYVHQGVPTATECI